MKPAGAVENPIPLLDLKAQYASIREELAAAALKVMESGVFILGPEGRAFEEEFAKAQGAAFCSGLSSGTQALQVALEACGIGPGDEVAVPAFTFIATATVVAALGAKPVLMDVDGASLTLSIDDLRRRLKRGKGLKAVIPVHLYGWPADMDALLAAAKGLRVIEDCAQAHLARYRGKGVGSLGDFGAFSFYPSKNLGALGDAGCLTTGDRRLLEETHLLRDVGRKPGAPRYIHARIGHNSRLDELQAAFLRVKLRHLEEWTRARRRIANVYREELRGLPLRLPPEEAGGSLHAYHLFVVQTPKRDALAGHLGRAGIGTGVYYPTPLHLQPAFRHLGHEEGEFPESERASREVLALPMYSELPPDSARRVCQEIRRFFKR